ncbi:MULTISPECIES: ParM/StbA family protein [Peribacillus]|uniref:ParM/StbA family protein n=1 Tax=Peribacillus TaxID=2675229 RepID=UPI00203EF3C6|nr:MULTISPECIES: ParM/StbA family protein [Peribacillus]MCM3169595.1 ParM/StbA family protein [Peribacillus frigoritolerans]MEE3955730.1 ParM/StbA family protein [Peribacillus frigoritolerans]
MVAKCLHFALKNYIIKIVNKAKEKGNAKMVTNIETKTDFTTFLANDIGNDKMKIRESENPNSDVYKIESAYRRLTKKPEVQELDLQKNVMGLLDNLVVNITSDAIKRSGLYAIGKKATNVSKSGLYNMDIESGEKHEEDFMLIGSLGFIAARTVQKEYALNSEVRPVLSTNVFMSTAIPASQHNAVNAKFLEERFTKNTHIVIVFLGDKQVTVNVTFERVKVMKEGVPALYAILEGENEMFKEFNENYKLNWTGKDFADKKIMHTDIGSGTTEYIFTNGVNPVSDRCSGERQGMGHAIAAAIELLKDERKGLSINRQQFSKYIEQPNEYPKDSELAKTFLAETSLEQSDSILDSIITKNARDMSNETEIFTVYGGGSIEFKDEMYAELNNYAESQNAKLLWIPQKYTVTMNVDGLNNLNRNLFYSKELEM